MIIKQFVAVLLLLPKHHVALPSTYTARLARVNEVFDDNGKLVDERYDKTVMRFLDEFEWYIEALRNQRKNGTPY